jgi:hypothetical protein
MMSVARVDRIEILFYYIQAHTTLNHNNKTGYDNQNITFPVR